MFVQLAFKNSCLSTFNLYLKNALAAFKFSVFYVLQFIVSQLLSQGQPTHFRMKPNSLVTKVKFPVKFNIFYEFVPK